MYHPLYSHSCLLKDKHNLVALQIINHYHIADKIPPDGQVTFQNLAESCNLPQDILTRIIRQAMTYDVFFEPQPGHVAHTKTSLAIPSQAPLLSYQLEIALPSSMNLLKSLKSEEGKTAFQIAHNTTDDFFTYASKTGNWMEEYGRYQSIIAQGGAYAMSHLINGYDWDKLVGSEGKEKAKGKATVIDIGGGDGSIAIALAQEFPNLHITVQDCPQLVSAFHAKLPPTLASRVEFTPHSFFDAQPASSASPVSVFLLRHILHDWPTPNCHRILRNIVDAMGAGAGSRLIVAEQVMPREFTSEQQGRVMRALDMQMMVQYGSQERTMEDWEALFAAVGLRVIGTKRPEGSADTIMEVVRAES